MTEPHIHFIKALTKARKEFRIPTKDQAGMYAHASLSSLKNAIDDALTKNGINYTYEINQRENNEWTLSLIVEHENGEQRISVYPLNTTQSQNKRDVNQIIGVSQSRSVGAGDGSIGYIVGIVVVGIEAEERP